MLNFGPSQRMLTRFAADELSQLLHTRVSIGRVEVGLFNRVLLHDVCVKDRQQADLLRAQLITAKIELRSLLRRKPLSLRSVSLLDTDVRLYKVRPDSATNFQFVLDAFASKKKKGPSTLDLRINSLILRRVNVSYDQRYSPQTPGRLNPAHLGLRDINANISLKRLSPRDVALRVRSFALAERSGLRIRDLSFKLTATQTQARLTDLELRLPASVIRQREALFRYDIRQGMGRLGQTLRAHGRLDEARIATADLVALVPKLKGMNLVADVGANYDITADRIGLDRFTVNTPDGALRLAANASLRRTAGSVKGVSVKLDQLQTDGGALARWLHPFVAAPIIAEALPRMGRIGLTGAAYYNKGVGGAANVGLNTAVGLVAAKAQWAEPQRRLTAEARLTQLNPSFALAKPALPELVTATAEATLTFGANRQLAAATGRVDVPHLIWNQHHYTGLQANGTYDAGRARLQLASADPAARLHGQASLTLSGKQLTGLDGALQIERFVPAALGLHTRYGTAAFSGNVSASLEGLRGASLATLPAGHVKVSGFTMNEEGHAPYRLDQLDLTLSPHGEGGGLVQLTSDFADLRLTGPTSPDVARTAVGQLLNRALPGLWKERVSPHAAHSARWDVAASVKRTDFFQRMLGIDLHLVSPVLAHGTIDGGAGRTALTVTTDGWQIGSQTFGPTSLYLNGQGRTYQLLAKTRREVSGKQFDCIANLQTEGGTLLTDISWLGETAKRYEGRFVSETRFDGDSLRQYPHHTTMDMHIRPGHFVLSDTVWNIASGDLSLKGRGLTIRNFRLSHADQSLTADGHIAPGKNDSIVARLKNIDVDYILGLVDFHAVEFGGRATGVALFSQEAGATEVSARLNIPQFTFNKGRMGAAYIIGSWSKADNRINLDADMRLPRYKGEEAGTAVKGYVDLAHKNLQLDISARQTNLQFLRCYVDNIFERFDGRATGDIRLYGPLKQLDFDGRVKAEASATVAATGVRYDVTDADVLFSPGSFAFRHCKVSDGRGGTGEANGELRHTHLKRLNYDFDLTATRLLCYDQPQSPGLPFYSTTTGSGRVHLSGQPGRFSADINLTPDAPTTLVYLMGGGEAVGSSDNSMIRFHEINDDEDDSLGLHPVHPVVKATGDDDDDEDDGPGTDIWLNFLINATPAAQVKIVTDQRTGDAITVYGNGPIRATWHNKGGFEMYGTYTLTRGTYRLSLQDVIRKELTIVPGSTLTFSGNPLEADLGLKAKYTVSGVSLSDLNYGAGFSQKSVKVDCLVNIGGKARNPQIDFDLDLQGISEDEKQMVRQLIATDEDMNRQVIYLLGIGRFYAANTDAGSSITTQQQSSAAMRSFLSNTLTGQLNSAISSVLGTDSHWSFGTNLAPGTLGWSDLEVEGLLQGRLLNDRLLINGNFGYRDRPTYTSNFIGDFDIRYLLTPRGSVSLRAYSETTDRYFTKASMTTQGIGLTLQKDFNRFTDLFWWRKKPRWQSPVPAPTPPTGGK